MRQIRLNIIRSLRLISLIGKRHARDGTGWLFISHREKIAKLGLDFRLSELTQAPILDACPVDFGL